MGNAASMEQGNPGKNGATLPKNNASKNNTSKNNAPKNNAPKNNAPKNNAPKNNAPKNNAPRNNVASASSPRLPPSNANNGNVEAALPANISTEGTVGNNNSRRGSNASNIFINKNNEVGVNVPSGNTPHNSNMNKNGSPATGGRRCKSRKSRKVRKSRN